MFNPVPMGQGPGVTVRKASLSYCKGGSIDARQFRDEICAAGEICRRERSKQPAAACRTIHCASCW